MDDYTPLIWLGIAIVWFLAKLVRRGAKKVVEAQKRPSRPPVARTAPAATPLESQRFVAGETGHSAKPIVPR